MVRSVSIAVIAVLSAVASGASQTASPPLDVMPGLVKALAAKDVEAVLAFYSEDALLLPANEPAVKGKDNIRRWYQKLLADGYKAVQMESNTGMRQGSVGYVTSTYVVNVPSTTGSKSSGRDLFRSVMGLRHDQSKWLIESHAVSGEGSPRCK